MDAAPQQPQLVNDEFTVQPTRWRKFKNASQNLSSSKELILFVILCFGYPIVVSTIHFFDKPHTVHLTSAVIIRRMVLTVIVITVAGLFLRLRGWNFRAIGFHFSWRGVVAGVPL